MTYAVKEIFYTLQGEGANAGRPAVFCRFAGCNLWTGREEDRADAVCRFCDTDFVGTDGPGGGKFAVGRGAGRRGRGRLARRATGRAAASWSAPAASRCSSSTPPLIDALHARGLRGRGRDQRHPAAARRASTGSASAPRPAPTGGRPRATSSSWSIPQDGRRARAVRGPRLPPLLPPADGRARRARPTPRAALALLPRAPALAAQPADAQASRHSVTSVSAARHARILRPHQPRVRLCRQVLRRRRPGRRRAWTTWPIPANVAVILARYGCEQITIVAGILHHVLEESPPDQLAGAGAEDRRQVRAGRAGRGQGRARAQVRPPRRASGPGRRASRSI